MDKIVMAELIGLDVKIIKSTSRNLTGLKGTVIDETLKTFIIESGGKEKTVPKEQCVFRFYKDGEHDVDGRSLAYRPEDRIKKYWKDFI